MGWYKMHHGIPLEAKLAVVAKRAGCRRGEALALWVVLLDHASRAIPRGSVSNIDLEEIAATLEFDPAAIEPALKAFHDKNMILADGSLAGWEKNQRLSTSRTRAHRARAPTGAAFFDKSETDTARRQRLQNEILARHKKRGRTLAE